MKITAAVSSRENASVSHSIVERLVEGFRALRERLQRAGVAAVLDGMGDGIDAQGDDGEEAPQQIAAKKLVALAVKAQPPALHDGMFGLPAQDHALGPGGANAHGNDAQQPAQQTPADELEGGAVEMGFGGLDGGLDGGFRADFFHGESSLFFL